MNLPTCNPEIYRLAAKLLCNPGPGQSPFSCTAISDAATLLNLSWRQRTMAVAQYQAMFGPKPGKVEFAGRSWNWNLNTWDFPFASDWRAYDKAEADHPFWNKSLTPERQEQRILALLLMADICENPQ